MPAAISPITGGCPNRRITTPASLHAATITAIARNNRASGCCITDPAPSPPGRPSCEPRSADSNATTATAAGTTTNTAYVATARPALLFAAITTSKCAWRKSVHCG